MKRSLKPSDQSNTLLRWEKSHLLNMRKARRRLLQKHHQEKSFSPPERVHVGANSAWEETKQSKLKAQPPSCRYVLPVLFWLRENFTNCEEQSWQHRSWVDLADNRVGDGITVLKLRTLVLKYSSSQLLVACVHPLIRTDVRHKDQNWMKWRRLPLQSLHTWNRQVASQLQL